MIGLLLKIDRYVCLIRIGREACLILSIGLVSQQQSELGNPSFSQRLVKYIAILGSTKEQLVNVYSEASIFAGFFVIGSEVRVYIINLFEPFVLSQSKHTSLSTSLR